MEPEIFEIIKAFNRLEGKVNTLKDNVNGLNAKIDLLLKSPFKNVTLNADSAAHLLGVHPNTLYKLRREGKVPYLQINRRVLYSAADLLKYIRSKMKKGL
jgi:excisionase family DNA binding protein